MAGAVALQEASFLLQTTKRAHKTLARVGHNLALLFMKTAEFSAVLYSDLEGWKEKEPKTKKDHPSSTL